MDGQWGDGKKLLVSEVRVDRARLPPGLFTRLARGLASEAMNRVSARGGFMRAAILYRELSTTF